MTINLTYKLTVELLAAGLPISGVDSNGVISWSTPPTPSQETEAATIVAAHDDSTPLGYVSCLTTGPKLIGIVGDPDQRFFAERYRIIVVQATGVTTPPTVSLGTNGPDYNNVAPATALGSIGLNAAGLMRNVLVGTSSPINVILNRVAVYVNVTVAANAGAFIIRVDFIGDYEPK